MDDVIRPKIGACFDVCARAVDSSHMWLTSVTLCVNTTNQHKNTDSVHLLIQTKVTIFSKTILNSLQNILYTENNDNSWKIILMLGTVINTVVTQCTHTQTQIHTMTGIISLSKKNLGDKISTCQLIGIITTSLYKSVTRSHWPWTAAVPSTWSESHVWLILNYLVRQITINATSYHLYQINSRTTHRWQHVCSMWLHPLSSAQRTNCKHLLPIRLFI